MGVPTGGGGGGSELALLFSGSVKVSSYFSSRPLGGCRTLSTPRCGVSCTGRQCQRIYGNDDGQPVWTRPNASLTTLDKALLAMSRNVASVTIYGTIPVFSRGFGLLGRKPNCPFSHGFTSL
jgi:hypothetical protein